MLGGYRHALGLALAFSLVGVWCFAQTQRVAVTASTSGFNIDFSRQPLPIFRGGIILARQLSPPGFSAFDVSGKLLHHQNIVIPGATSLTVDDVASTQNGETIAVLVSATDASGHFSSSILLTGVNALETKAVRLDAFAPRRIIFGANNVLWAFGQSYDSSFREPADYDTLRSYDQNGKLLGSSVPRSTFRPTKASPSSESLIAVGKDRIGVLSLITSEWVEVSNEGQILGRGPVRIPENADITGFAMTNSHEVFVTQQAISAETKTATDAITLRQLDKATGELIRVDTQAVTKASNQGMLLLGNQGDELVVRVKPPMSLSWVRVQ